MHRGDRAVAPHDRDAGRPRLPVRARHEAGGAAGCAGRPGISPGLDAGPDYGSYFRHGPLGDFFTACYVSGELGLLKPHPDIYRHVLDDLRITPAEAQKLMAQENTLVVDVRDAPEVEKSGKVAGAVHVPRGMLEFRADPESPYYDQNFAKDKTVIVYCAAGGRAALSGQALKEMGYGEVYNLGGFNDWAEAGGAIEGP